MRYVWIAALLWACGGNAFVGRVVDEGGAPVARAEVSTEPATDIVLTKENGVFTLRQVVDPTGEVRPIEDGSYTVVVRKLGFLPLQFTVEADGGTHQLGERTLSTKQLEITPTAPQPTEPTHDHTRPDPPKDGGQ